MKGSVRQPLNEVQPQEQNVQEAEPRLSNGRMCKCICVEKQIEIITLVIIRCLYE